MLSHNHLLKDWFSLLLLCESSDSRSQLGVLNTVIIQVSRLYFGNYHLSEVLSCRLAVVFFKGLFCFVNCCLCWVLDKSDFVQRFFNLRPQRFESLNRSLNIRSYLATVRLHFRIRRSHARFVKLSRSGFGSVDFLSCDHLMNYSDQAF